MSNEFSQALGLSVKQRKIASETDMNDELSSNISLFGSDWRKMIFELITLHGYTTKAIALELNVSPRTVHRLLVGQTKNPSLQTRVKLAETYSQNRCQEE